MHAGGTDLLGCLHDGVFETQTVVSLTGVEGLGGVRERDDGGVTIGAMTTIAHLTENPLIQQRYPGLAQAAGEVASPQLRNQGTLGGNLCQKPRCWYYRGDFHCLRKGGYKCFALTGENQFHCIFGGANCYIVHPSDPAPALVALDADLKVVGPKGTRRLAVADLHMPPDKNPTRETTLAPGEVIVEVRLPPPPQGLYNSYRKIRTRRAWDFAIAGCALALRMDGDTVRDCPRGAVRCGTHPVAFARDRACAARQAPRRRSDSRGRRRGGGQRPAHEQERLQGAVVPEHAGGGAGEGAVGVNRYVPAAPVVAASAAVSARQISEFLDPK